MDKYNDPKYQRKPGQFKTETPESQEYRKWILENHENIEKQYGLPKGALLALSAHESQLDPYARSQTNAIGAFQFTRGTGRAFGLRIDNEVDDRYDYVKSAHAAGKYLQENMRKFGSYELAIADYNGGGNAVRHLKSGGNPDDYLSPNGRKELGGFMRGVREKAKSFGITGLFESVPENSPYTPEKGLNPKDVASNSVSVDQFAETTGLRASPKAQLYNKPSKFFNPYMRREILKQHAEKEIPVQVTPVQVASKQQPLAQAQEPEKPKAEMGAVSQLMKDRPDLFRAYKSGGKIIQYSGDEKTIEAVLKGKERIYSRMDTKRLMELAQKADSEDSLFLLGKFIYDATKKQDSRPAEYVDA